MNQLQMARMISDDDSNCFGDFDKTNPLCMKHCVLRLRCNIEKDHNLRTELIEELISSDNEVGRIQ